VVANRRQDRRRARAANQSFLGSDLAPDARGLTTLPLPLGLRTFTIEFDFIDHKLLIRTTDGEQRTVALAPRSVADFYREVMATLDSMSLPVKIRTCRSRFPHRSPSSRIPSIIL